MTQQTIITFVDNKDQLHRITFRLYDSSLAKRWQALVKQNILRPESYGYSTFINKTFDDMPEILEALNNVSAEINQTYDRILPRFTDTTSLDQEILNTLHEEYEIYGDRLQHLVDVGYFDNPKTFPKLYNHAWPAEVQNFKLHDNFLKLNELIHTVEEILHNQDAAFAPMSALIDVYPQELYDTILEKDKLYLTNIFNWGRLYLGYNTLGKDWLEVSHHNDIDVIKRAQVRPQERFSAEAWINFAPDDDINYSNSQFEKWYDALPDDLQQQIPINNLSKLCLGRFEIGAIVYDDYFIKYDTIDHWQSQNHKCKSDWNRSVFSTFTHVISIEFREVP